LIVLYLCGQKLMEINQSHYTIYFNSSAVELSENLSSRNLFLSYRIKNMTDVKSFFDEYLQEKNPNDCILYGKKPEKLLSFLKSYFAYIEAAGGLVMNMENKYLFIKRLGIWDLPKGKIEKNESPKDCALREVEEETAINALKIIEDLPSTFHIYKRQEKFYLKKTFWYLMETNSEKDLVPQEDEEITMAVWLGKTKAAEAISESYRSLKDTFLGVFKG